MRCRGLEAISCQTLFSSALASSLARGSDASGTPCDALAFSCIWHWRLICQFPASLGGTRLGHSVLLLSGFGFRICKCTADRRWAQRDCQTRHRARLGKAPARSVVWLFHGVRLSSSSGIWGCVVIVSSLHLRSRYQGPYCVKTRSREAFA